MIGRIFLFGTGVVSLLLLTLIYAMVSGQYAERQPTPEPTPSIAVPSPGSAEPSASVNPEPSPAGSGEVAMVMIENTSFGGDLTVAAGTAVQFTNGDDFAHTATDGTDGIPVADPLFDLQLAAGASDSFTFTEPGTYQVTCTLHPTMNMTITVE